MWSTHLYSSSLGRGSCNHSGRNLSQKSAWKSQATSQKQARKSQATDRLRVDVQREAGRHAHRAASGRSKGDRAERHQHTEVVEREDRFGTC